MAPRRVEPGLALLCAPSFADSRSTLVRRRFAPHQLRHAHAVELARGGVAVNLIRRQLGHTDLGTTSTNLQGIDPAEIIEAVNTRRAPMIPATAGLRF
jgi:integrase